MTEEERYREILDMFHDDFVSVSEQIGGDGRYLLLSFAEVLVDGEKGIKTIIVGNANPMQRLAGLRSLEEAIAEDFQTMVAKAAEFSH